MTLTSSQLHRGIRYWRTTRWPQDFHNAFYKYELAPIRKTTTTGVFNQQWWDQFFPILRQWLATRPSKPEVLTARARERFIALGRKWASAVAPHLDKDIAALEWHQIAAFPLLVAEIKDVRSPTFTSKFCHFLAPRIFHVVDKAALGNPFPTYASYFTAARAEWIGTDATTQDDLVALLTKEVEKLGAPLFSGFPMKSKIIELCLIGRHNYG